MRTEFVRHSVGTNYELFEGGNELSVFIILIRPSIHSFIHSIQQYVLRQASSLFQSKFSRKCYLVFPVSVSNTLFFPLVHPVVS